MSLSSYHFDSIRVGLNSGNLDYILVKKNSPKLKERKKSRRESYLTAPSPAAPLPARSSAGGRTQRRTGWQPAARSGTSPRAGRGRWAAAGSLVAGRAAGVAWPTPSLPWSALPSRSNGGSGSRGSRRCWSKPPPRWCSAGSTVPSERESLWWSAFPASFRFSVGYVFKNKTNKTKQTKTTYC